MADSFASVESPRMGVDDQLLRPEILWDRPAVVMFTAPNAGPMTLEGTHTFIVGTTDCYVIDPGPVNHPYGRALADWLGSNGRAVQALLLTHGHPDHAPGATFLSHLLAVPIRAPANLNRSYLPDPTETVPFSEDETFAVDGDRLRVIDTPGHSSDHVAFLMEGAGILFSGDTILGTGTSLVAPPDGDMVEYLKTLEALRRLKARLIAPGHGPIVVDPARKIEEYLLHRRRREEQIVEALSRGPRTPADLVAALYADINPSLRTLAAGSVQGQLEKLVVERRVVCLDGRYVLRE
jgi:glyoxylase-like metal-dependent hydrolase (beta-lactamase superfamily II)